MATIHEQYREHIAAQEREATRTNLIQHMDAGDIMHATRAAMYEAVNTYFKAVIDYHLSRGASAESSRDNAVNAIESLYEYGVWTDAIQEAYDNAAP
jgi:hypothetical protein